MRYLQKICWGSLTACLGFAALLQAQNDSTTVGQNFLPPERIAIFGFSEMTLAQKPAQHLAQALVKICSQDARFVVTAENTLTLYLKKRRQFSIFIPDSVQALCKNLALQSLLAVSIEAKAETATPNSWLITLRWLEGGTGQIAKIHSSEYTGDINAVESFPLNEVFNALLEAPDIIVPEDRVLTEVPLPMSQPEIAALPINSPEQETSPVIAPVKRSRSWLWYVTGAALVSGGSAAILLKNPAKSGSAGKTLLPEPPDPPK